MLTVHYGSCLLGDFSYLGQYSGSPDVIHGMVFI